MTTRPKPGDLELARKAVSAAGLPTDWSRDAEENLTALRALRLVVGRAAGQAHPIVESMGSRSWPAARGVVERRLPDVPFPDVCPDGAQAATALLDALRAALRSPRVGSTSDLFAYYRDVAAAIDEEAFNTHPSRLRVEFDELRAGLLPCSIEDELDRAALVIGVPKRGEKRDALFVLPCILEGSALAPDPDRSPILIRRAFFDADDQPKWAGVDLENVQPSTVTSEDEAPDAQTVESSDHADASPVDWARYVSAAEAAWREVTGSDFHDTRWMGHVGRLEAHLIDIGKQSSGLADRYREVETLSGDALGLRSIGAVVATERVPSRRVDPAEAPWAAVLGHMDERSGEARSGFALDASQRLAAATFLGQLGGPPSVLAVNGPPGTGKTSFLRSVLASLWVEDAANGLAHPRRVLATGFTNKAVENVIEAFGAVAGDAPGALTTRWLPGLPSYGWFLASKSKITASLAGGPSAGALDGLMVLAQEKGGCYSAAFAAAPFQSALEHGAAGLVAEYLRHASLALGTGSVDDAVSALQRRLKEQLDATAAARTALWALAAEVGRHAERTSAVRADAGRRRLRREENSARWRDFQRLIPAASIADRWLRSVRPRSPWMAVLEWILQFVRPAVAAKRRSQGDELEADLLRALAALPTNGTWRAGLPLEERAHVVLDACRQAREAAPASAPPDADEDALSIRLERAGLIASLRAAFGPLEGRPGAEVWLRQWRPRLRELLRGRLPFEEVRQAIEASLDVRFRFEAFHLAARYWEGRWLQHAAAADRGEAPTLPPFAQWAMLGVTLVATARRLERLMAEFGDPVDVLVVDEAGQCSVLDGLWLLAHARHALVVGDVHQLEPIYPISAEDSRRIAASVGFGRGALPYALDAARGSLIEAAHRGCALEEADAAELGGQRGIMLRTHYRCPPAIAEYCNGLSYGGTMRMAQAVESVDKARLELRMSWVDVRGEPVKVDGSWVNREEVAEIVRWLEAEGPELCGDQPIDTVIAVIAPLRAQAQAIREAVRTGLASRFPADALDRMVIGTVHRLQGAERPIVAFSLTQTAAPLFADRDGGRLMNVAVSRAKKQFVVFGDRRVLGPVRGDRRSAAPGKPVAQLGNYLQTWGCRRYPRYLVLIEAPGKKPSVERALGLDAAVVPTGGSFDDYDGMAADGTLRFVLRERGWLGAAEVYRDLPELVVATDDDMAGELIGWRATDTLRREIPAFAPALIKRMRFSSTEPEELRRAHRMAGGGFDAALLKAALVRTVTQAATHERLVSAQLPPSLPQLAVLEVLAAWRPGAAHLWLEGPQGQQVEAFVVERTGIADRPIPLDVESARRFLNMPIGPWRRVPSLGQNQRPYPRNTTARVLGLAADELGLNPDVAQAHLNALYLDGASRDKT